MFNVIGGVAVFFVVLFGVAYGGYQLDLYFWPRYEQLRTDTFHNSQMYNDGMRQDLENDMREYAMATKDQKDALRGLMLHRFSVYPIEKMTTMEKDFYMELQNQQ